jgi:hypothetical protein
MERKSSVFSVVAATAISGTTYRTPQVKVAAWVESLEPVYSKSGNFEGRDILNYKYCFSKKHQADC